MKHYPLSTLSCALLLSFAVNESYAGSMLKCETRANPARADVTVGFEGLTTGALYTATIVSGENTALASTAADPAGTVRMEFSSNTTDILAGKTEISSNFVVDKVSVTITDALGNIMGQTTGGCSTKK